ncbi:heme peroxidase [Entomortierella chlamydospora]|uniref:Peroxidase n=1 Tax=Entomortierella chlamydospora TaxID=101097 RepID=A0A9P6MQZ4_9FUNG|nr:heme peroxidase [Entomortierella chlamydospora]KAG0010266.1 heme peroxidase [Entomortierella chlamydospora]
MASTARFLLRTSSLSTFARRATVAAAVAPRFTAVRTFASHPPQRPTGVKASSGGMSPLVIAVLAAGAGAAGYHYYVQGSTLPQIASTATSGGEEKKPLDYQKVYNAIAELLEDDNYDDGSYGPIFLRLAWHSSGTYDKNAGNGGSSYATMRFKPESSSSANAGLIIARERLHRVKDKFPDISYGDLWTLAGVCAVQEMGGPIIKWRSGRIDGEEKDCPPEGRLPDGGRADPQHSRDIFYKMGFNDQEIVALLGAHALGRCHRDRSGFDGPWTASPTVFTNSYFTELLGRTWVERKWSGPKQFEDKETKSLMMLPADMAMLKDKEFKKWVEIYAKDEKKFFEDFAKAAEKLFELGCKFDENSKIYEFMPTNA